MNKDEAEKVLRIMATAHSGCPFCAASLFLQFINEFPEYKGLAYKIFREEFAIGLREFWEGKI